MSSNTTTVEPKKCSKCHVKADYIDGHIVPEGWSLWGIPGVSVNDFCPKCTEDLEAWITGTMDI